MTEREKDAPRGDRTHTFCYPGRCPMPVRLEETSNSRLASVCNISDANSLKHHFWARWCLDETYLSFYNKPLRVPGSRKRETRSKFRVREFRISGNGNPNLTSLARTARDQDQLGLTKIVIKINRNRDSYFSLSTCLHLTNFKFFINSIKSCSFLR